MDDDKAAEVALQAGELDFSNISLSSTDKFQGDTNFTVDVIPSTAYSWVGMNIESPKLKDINVRQAVRYGIDVPSILAAAYNNKAPQANALIPPGTSDTGRTRRYTLAMLPRRRTSCPRRVSRRSI